MSFLNKLYPYLPVWIQNIGISIYGYFWQKRRFGGVFKNELIEFKHREKFTKQQWRDYQTKELRKILINAFVNVPFYNEKYTKAGFSLADFENFDLSDLPKLPYLEKDELRHFGRSALLSKKIDTKGAFYSSSGSTGTPTNIRISTRMHQIWTAGFETRIRNWAGITKDTARGTIGGRRVVIDGNNDGPYYRYNSIEKQVYFSAYHISDKTVDNYVEGMYKHQIEYMTGYAMSNYFLARFIEKKGIKAPTLKAVITSSEKLTPEMRDTFKRVYGCKSHDSYSGVEDCGLISECEHGKLHISPDLGIIEIIKTNGDDALPGEIGEAICTGILNYDQPLIRYRIGDLLKFSIDQTCNCGRIMPVIDEIIGRIEDTVIGIDGREMVRFHGVFINIPSIIEGQIIQNTLSDFQIKVVTSQPLDSSEKEIILKRMKSQLGNITLTISEVESIPRNQNGKFKAVISNLVK